jgi:uncharacterized C2H2 Zn-finger protein
MPRQGIHKLCPHCRKYGRIVTREPVTGRPGQTFIAAACPKCGRTDRTRAKFASRYVVKCKGFERADGTRRECGEPLMLAEFTSYDGRCESCAHAHDEIQEEMAVR